MELVGELVAGTAAARAFRVAALDHEIRDHAMENGAVVERLSGLGAVGQSDEVLDRLGRLVGEKLDLEVAFRGVECGVNLVCHHCDCSNPATSDARARCTMMDFDALDPDSGHPGRQDAA